MRATATGCGGRGGACDRARYACGGWGGVRGPARPQRVGPPAAGDGRVRRGGRTRTETGRAARASQAAPRAAGMRPVDQAMHAASAASTATLVMATGRENQSAMNPIAGGPNSMPP